MNWINDTLSVLAAEFPEIEWGKEPSHLLGYLDTAEGRLPVTVSREGIDHGWFRVQVFAGRDEEIVGMDPSDAVRAVRGALRRFNGGARALPLHVIEGGLS